MFLGPICLVLGKHMENAKHIFQRSFSDFVGFDASDKHWLFKMVSDNCRRNVLPSYICCWKFNHPRETIAKNNTTLFYSNVQILTSRSNSSTLWFWPFCPFSKENTWNSFSGHSSNIVYQLTYHAIFGYYFSGHGRGVCGPVWKMFFIDYLITWNSSVLQYRCQLADILWACDDVTRPLSVVCVLLFKKL